MRDRRRITQMCNLLVTMWLHKCPDMRFGQLIYNLFSFVERKYPEKDLFYLEDDEMADLMMEWFETIHNS